MQAHVPVELAKKTWLADLIDTTLQGYDPTVALLRLPTELRGADPDGPSLEGRARALLVRSLHRKLLNPAQRKSEDIFLSPLEGHVCLALDIALVHGSPFDARIRRAELAIFFGSLIGAFDLVRTIDPRRALDGAVVPVQRALVRAGIFLKATGYPPGDPRDGLPLRAGLLCIQRRQLARLAISYYGDGRLSVEIARKLFAQARLDALLLVEALAAIAAAGGPADAGGGSFFPRWRISDSGGILLAERAPPCNRRAGQSIWRWLLQTACAPSCSNSSCSPKLQVPRALRAEPISCGRSPGQRRSHPKKWLPFTPTPGCSAPTSSIGSRALPPRRKTG